MRSCSLTRSVKLKYLESCISQSQVPGRRSPFFPMLPKVPGPPVVVGFGSNIALTWLVDRNAAGLSQLLQALVTPAHAFALYGLAPATIVPRSFPILVPETFVPCNTVIGRPLAMVTNPPNSH